MNLKAKYTKEKYTIELSINTVYKISSADDDKFSIWFIKIQQEIEKIIKEDEN